MNAGEIIQRWHQFEDGERANKFFICLNDATDEDPAVLVVTTSVQKDWRKAQMGCFHHSFETYYVIQPGKVDWFDHLTFVRLDRRWLFTTADILKESLVQRNYTVVGLVSEQTLNAVIKCFGRSPDIDQKTWDIVEASRKSRQQAGKGETSPAAGGAIGGGNFVSPSYGAPFPKF